MFGGNIYLLGGQHYIHDNESSVSTATTAFGLRVRKKTASRKKRTAGKSNRSQKGVTNSILEEDEEKKTDGEGDISASNSKADDAHADALLKLNTANMTDK